MKMQYKNKIILYIDSMQMGGANRVIANLCTDFQKKGNDVILINDIAPNLAIPEYQVDSTVKRYYIDKIHYKNIIIRQLFRLLKIRSILKKEQPTVILSFMGPPNYRMLISSIGIKCRKVVSVRNDPYKEYGAGIKRILSNLIFLLADGCVFQTVEAANYFNSRIRKKSEIIFNPVNEKFYKQSRSSEKKEIVMVGRLEPQKNIKLAINAFSLVVKKLPEYTLVICGDGSQKEELYRYVKNLNLQKKIKFLGRVTDVEKKLASASLYMLTSDYEGMPNSLMEAMAVGVPVIATNCPCGGPKSLIKCDRQGILVPCNDITKLAEAMIYILSNESYREKLRVGALHRSLEFKSDIILKKWYDFLFKKSSRKE